MVMKKGNDRKRILIYGIANSVLRRKVEVYLNEVYEIIGYSDTYYKEDILQGENFIFPHQIINYNIDIVIACVEKEETYHEIKNFLENIGFYGNVIYAKRYFDSVCMYTPNLKEEVYQKKWKKSGISRRGVIFGLSYSLRGIDYEKLDGDFYDFSWHGLDLYYNSSLFSDAMKQWDVLPMDVSLMVIPYYYFDYDMSMSEYQYRTGQIYSVRDYGWHNGKLSFKGIQDYIKSDNLFGEKLFRVYKGKKYYPHIDMWGGDEKSSPLSLIWYNSYEMSVKENVQIFKNLLYETKNMIVIVPPFYIRNLSQNERKIIFKKKNKFYRLIEDLKSEFSFEIFDCLELYNNVEFFSDEWHLNYLGKEAFTKYINNTILNNQT